MSTKSNNNYLLITLQVISWIIFIGLLFDAGVILVGSILTYTVSPETVKHLWLEVDLSALYFHDRVYFIILVSLIVAVALLKAWLFYLIVRLLSGKKFDLDRPFSTEMTSFMQQLAYYSIGIGVICGLGAKQAKWIMKHVSIPDIQHLRLDGGDVWIFMGVILLVIAQVFKKGNEIQTENELTV